MDQINDTEGAMFWYGQFSNDRQVSFSVFVDAYQSYCTGVFLCRKFQRKHLLTLLRHTLLEQDVVSDAALLASEVSVTMFSQWLRRYGPMKDTLAKASVVSNPEHGKILELGIIVMFFSCHSNCRGLTFSQVMLCLGSTRD